MTRVEFMEELKNLLGGISEEERKEALEFYEAYFEDAGEEKEEEIIKELKSPKRLAESIKAGLNGEDRFVYTERGYEEDKKYKKMEGVSLEKENGLHCYQGDTQGSNDNKQKHEQNQKNTYAIIGILALILTSPLWGGILIALLGGIIGLIFGIAATLFGLFVASIALLIGGVAAIGYGFITLSGIVSIGILQIGIGLLCLGSGGLLFFGVVWLVRVAIPTLMKFLIDVIKKLFKKEGKCRI